MKAIKPLILLALMISGADLQAQKPITISEDSIAIVGVNLPGLTVSIPEVNYERTQKNWVKELQTGTKSNVVIENGEMSIFGTSFKDISPNALNVYSKLQNQDSLLRLLVVFELKKDQYIEKATGEAELTAVKELLKQFAKDQYIDFVKDEVQAEEKKLKDLNNQLNELQNEKSRMQKLIQASRTDITTERDNIVIQNNEITKLTTEILEVNNQLTGMEAGAAKEEKVSYLKELEKRKKKFLNDVESSENKINKANNNINDAERDIPKNESDQSALLIKIGQQESVLTKFTEKLNTVKAY